MRRSAASVLLAGLLFACAGEPATVDDGPSSLPEEVVDDSVAPPTVRDVVALLGEASAGLARALDDADVEDAAWREGLTDSAERFEAIATESLGIVDDEVPADAIDEVRRIATRYAEAARALATGAATGNLSMIERAADAFADAAADLAALDATLP